MWKDIVGYEGIYQVSDLGDVKSLQRTARVRNGIRTVPERILKTGSGPFGYKTVRLAKDLTYTTELVHRLVATAFLPNPDNLPCVNHKDGNPNNNDASNLEWCTHEYNSNYYLCKQKQSDAMKLRYANPEQLHENIRHPRPVCQLTMSGELVRVYPTIASVTEFGFSKDVVRNCAICLGGHWKKPTRHGFSKSHKGFQWMWLSDYEKGDVLSSLHSK